MNALIIGAGSIGKRHAQILEELGFHVNFVSKRSDLKNVVTNSINNLKSIESYDYFLICNESNKHYETLLQLTQKINNKIILIENPLFTKYENIKINNKCYVGYNLRFHPIVKNALLALKTEKIISVDIRCSTYLPDWNPERDYSKTYSANLALGGGVLKDVSHEIDLLYYITKEKGEISKKEVYKKISNLKIETNDYYRSIGMIGSINYTLSLDYISRIPKREIQICSNEKTINLDFITSTLQIKNNNKNITTNYVLERNETYSAMHKNILFNNGKNCCTFKDGQRVLKWF